MVFHIVRFWIEKVCVSAVEKNPVNQTVRCLSCRLKVGRRFLRGIHIFIMMLLGNGL